MLCNNKKFFNSARIAIFIKSSSLALYCEKVLGLENFFHDLMINLVFLIFLTYLNPLLLTYVFTSKDSFNGDIELQTLRTFWYQTRRLHSWSAQTRFVLA